MIPRKLAELFFSQIWILLIPVLLVPVLVMAIASSTPEYESHATVWVGASPAGEEVAFGQTVSYRTPAQNQAQVVNDLLATEAFRQRVAVGAGIIPEDASPAQVEQGIRKMQVWASTIGTNLVVLTARAPEATEAADVVNTVIDEYLARATFEVERNAELSQAFYEQQLSVAEAELARRQEALDQYVAQNPEAAEAPSNGTPSLDYSALVNRVEQQRGVVEELQGALQTTERMLASAPQGQEAAFSVQDAARPPRAPLPTGMTSRFGLPAAGLVLGLLIAAGHLLVRYRIDHTIRSSEDMEEFRAPVLGTIAELKPSGLLWRLNPTLLLNRRLRREFGRRTAASITQLDEPGA